VTSKYGVQIWDPVTGTIMGILLAIAAIGIVFTIKTTAQFIVDTIWAMERWWSNVVPKYWVFLLDEIDDDFNFLPITKIEKPDPKLMNPKDMDKVNILESKLYVPSRGRFDFTHDAVLVQMYGYCTMVIFMGRERRPWVATIQLGLAHFMVEETKRGNTSHITKVYQDSLRKLLRQYGRLETNPVDFMLFRICKKVPGYDGLFGSPKICSKNNSESFDTRHDEILLVSEFFDNHGDDDWWANYTKIGWWKISGRL
jgi:hypothetical protein